MSKRRLSFWDVLAWLILFLILVWIILKAFGIINTPVSVEYTPYFGAIYLAGWAMKKLDTAVDDIKDLKRFTKDTVNEIHNIKTNCLKNHSS